MLQRALPLGIAVTGFVAAAFCLLQINRLDRLTVPQDQRAAIETTLTGQGIAPLPMADPPGDLIDAAVRFRSPGCGDDSYILPLSQGISAAAYGVRFTELSGATYLPVAFHLDGRAERRGPVASQIMRNLRQIGMVFGMARVQNTHIVLTVFQPEGCATGPFPDVTAFWSPPEAAR